MRGESRGLRSSSNPFADPFADPFALPEVTTPEVDTSRPRRERKKRKGGLGERLKGRALDAIAERMGLDEGEKEVAGMILDTALAMKFGPKAAITKLGLELARRGGRDVADYVVGKLVEDGKLSQRQANAITSRLDRIAPEGLPDPLKDAAVNAGRFARARIDTEKNRERARSARQGVSSAASRARGRLTREESTQNPSDPFGNPFPPPDTNDGVSRAADAGRRTMRRIRERMGMDEEPTVFDPSDPFSGRGLRSSTGRGLRSGTPKRLQPGEFKGEKTTILSDEGLEGFRTVWEIEVWDFAGEKVMFGARPEVVANNPEIKDMPLNPYVISGFPESSEEGKQAASDFIYAVTYANSEGSLDESAFVAALLYASSRGDTEAEKTLKEMARIGRQMVEESRKKLQIQREEGIRKEKEERQKWIEQVEAMDISDETKERLLRPSRDSDFSGLSVDDLFLVHETPYEPEVDEDGNLILRPSGDYGATMPMGTESTGYYYIPLNRGTVHFALNHIVSGHSARETPESSRAIVIPLREFIKHNPDALDNLYGVDTYASAAPGSGLVIPKGSFAMAGLTRESKRGEIVANLLEEMGMPREVKLSGDSSGLGWNVATAEKRISGIADELGVTNHMANAGVQAETERLRVRDVKMRLYVNELATMSENAILRLAVGDRWISSRQIPDPNRKESVV